MDKYIDSLIELAIAEDIGDGDHTSLAVIPASSMGVMQLIVKEKGILAGVAIARRVFERLDSQVVFDERIADGSPIDKGEVAFYVSGRTRSLLQAERIVLNIMQRMSGVATQTAIYANELKGLKCKVLDTRKT
ncbi:MAG: nicotinate-nucleotide diphosphorylase (carboxylating), partial [Mucinivorans sp.]